ncbi:MAG: NADPH-dependent oxidoreductase [Hyphomicrobiales bacterium]|mgnify:CR=1 FL=1|nr:MAG: NADPH-dependent oxidoreductase [Hyphomicrobiales bacterium]
MANIFIVSGSHRENSQSGRMARYIEGKLEGLGASGDILDLGRTPLPLWREDFWDDPRPEWAVWEPIAKRLQEADGLVVIAPEWHGMAPAALKNFFLLTTRNEVADKPGLLVGVSGGPGGTYPIAELRMSSTKNNRLCYIPDQMIIRNVGQVFLDPDNMSDEDRYFDARLEHDLRLLLAYSEALATVRAANLRNWTDFGNGM